MLREHGEEAWVTEESGLISVLDLDCGPEASLEGGMHTGSPGRGVNRVVLQEMAPVESPALQVPNPNSYSNPNPDPQAGVTWSDKTKNRCYGLS